jgi:hypothetical protein
MTNTKWLTLLAAAAVVSPQLSPAQDDVLIPGGPIEVQAQTLNLGGPLQVHFDLASADDDKDGDATAAEYFLGVQVAVVPELAKRQLAIEHGLAVEDVAPESPAAKAEIKKYDILIQAGDTPLKNVGDLIKSVEAAKGKQIVITLKRDGQSRKVEATAEQRAKDYPHATAARWKLDPQSSKFSAEIKELEEAMEKLKAKAGREGFGMWFAKPAIVAPRIDVRTKEETTKTLKVDFPKDLSVQINKQGNEPTKIHVKRGDQEWDVTEDKLGDLPEDIRTHVLMMLGKMKGPTVIASGDRKIWLTPEGKIEGEFKIPPMPPMPPRPAAAPVAPVPPVPPAKPAAAARAYAITGKSDKEMTDAKLDAIMKTLEKLEKEVEHLRDKK